MRSLVSVVIAIVVFLLVWPAGKCFWASMTDVCSPGARKALSQSLASFIPSIMQNASQIAERLELFRTETLAGFEPIDKKKEAANAEMDELLDETLGLQNLAIPDLHVDKSRAGLYIYLNAAVGQSHAERRP